MQLQSIYKFSFSVCLFVSNKRQNGWTDRAQIFWGILRDPREGLWIIKFSKICLHQNSFFENFENPRIFCFKSANFFILQCTQWEHVNNGNGRWARSALIAYIQYSCMFIATKSWIHLILWSRIILKTSQKLIYAGTPILLGIVV